jgi:hypothetical protein
MISTSDWTDKDGSFSVVKMFNKIVKLFEDPNDPWTIDTLQWYQQYAIDFVRVPSLTSIPEGCLGLLGERTTARRGQTTTTTTTLLRSLLAAERAQTDPNPVCLLLG